VVIPFGLGAATAAAAAFRGGAARRGRSPFGATAAHTSLLFFYDSGNILFYEFGNIPCFTCFGTVLSFTSSGTDPFVIELTALDAFYGI